MIVILYGVNGDCDDVWRLESIVMHGTKGYSDNVWSDDNCDVKWRYRTLVLFSLNPSQ